MTNHLLGLLVVIPMATSVVSVALVAVAGPSVCWAC